MKYLPINIIQTNFNKRSTHLLLSYLKLKELSNSFGLVDIQDFRGLANKIGLTPKSIKNHIVELKKRGYIQDALNNPNCIVVTSVWKVLGSQIKFTKQEQGKQYKSSYTRYCVNVESIKFLEFSHKELSCFNAYLAECLIEQILREKCNIEKEIALVEEVINQVADTQSTVEVLRYKLKQYKETQSKLAWVKSNGNWGKSGLEINDKIQYNKHKLNEVKKLLLAFGGKIAWDTLPENLQKLQPGYLLTNTASKESSTTKDLVDRESSSIVKESKTEKSGFTPVNVEKLFKLQIEETLSENGTDIGRFDTSLSWSKSLLNRSMTTVIKYRKRLAKKGLVSQTPVNLNKSESTNNEEKLVNYYYPFKLVKSGFKLNQLTAESMEKYYDHIVQYNKEETKSRRIMTKAGIKEIFSAQRSSQIVVKKKRIKVKLSVVDLDYNETVVISQFEKNLPSNLPF